MHLVCHTDFRFLPLRATEEKRPLHCHEDKGRQMQKTCRSLPSCQGHRQSSAAPSQTALTVLHVWKVGGGEATGHHLKCRGVAYGGIFNRGKKTKETKENSEEEEKKL